MIKRFLSNSFTTSLGIIKGRYYSTNTGFAIGTGDWTFKRIFSNKHFLLPVLNHTFGMKEDPITDYTIIDPSHQKKFQADITTAFDLRCKTQDNKTITVEMQRIYQPHFSDKALYNWSLEISKQGQKGLTDKQTVFPDDPIFSAAPILFGTINYNTMEHQTFKSPITKSSQGETPMKLAFIQLPNFPVSNITENSSITEKLASILPLSSSLESIDELPKPLKNEPLVIDMLEKLRLSNLSKKELLEYELSERHANDQYAIVKGFEEELKKVREEKDKALEEIDRALEEKDKSLEEKEKEIRERESTQLN